MSRYNKRVLIIDADFGLANIEVLLGLAPKHTFAELLDGSKQIQEIVNDGPMGIKFISGGSGLVQMADLTERQIKLVVENFRHLENFADIILLDTGAGISRTVINFIRSATEAIVVTTPEPPAITDAYTVIKATNDNQEDSTEFSVVVNRVEDGREGQEVYTNFNKASERFLEQQVAFLGHIPNDIYLEKAVRKQQPVAISSPNSPSARAIDNIGIKILNMTPEKRNAPDGVKEFLRRLVNTFGK
jgi:flagellar biosynthesis protein FlhG